MVTKDKDFVYMQDEKRPAPQILWITCGNTSNAKLEILKNTLSKAIRFFEKGDLLVEISDKIQ